MAEIVKAVSEHPLIKGKKFTQTVTIQPLSNDFSVDLAVGLLECPFRKAISERGYSVARMNMPNSVIQFSHKMRKTRLQDCIKVAIAFVLYKNDMLDTDTEKAS